MSRYETFVIRLWIEDEAKLDHGEIRHLKSGTGVRFRRVLEAMNFIERFSGEPQGQTSEVPQKPSTDD